MKHYECLINCEVETPKVSDSKYIWDINARIENNIKCTKEISLITFKSITTASSPNADLWLYEKILEEKRGGA